MAFNYLEAAVKKCNVNDIKCKHINVNGVNVWNSEVKVIPNPTDFPQSAYLTWAEEGSRVTFTVDETGCNFYNRGSGSDTYDGKRDAGIALNFDTDGHKYLNITYEYKGSSSGCHYRLKVGTNAGAKNTYDTVIETLIDNYCSKNVTTKSSKVNIEGYSNVGIGIFLHPSQDESLYVNITNLTLTDE